MALEWSAELEIGVDQIDEQHRQFFAAYAALAVACEDGLDAVMLVPLLDDLEAYAKTHFAAEEQLMLDTEFPGLAEQKMQHRQFTADLVNLRQQVKETGPTRRLAVTTSGTMVRWLINHIRHEDSQIGVFLRSNA